MSGQANGVAHFRNSASDSQRAAGGYSQIPVGMLLGDGRACSAAHARWHLLKFLCHEAP